MSRALFFSKNYLSKKFNVRQPNELYKQLLNNIHLFKADELQKIPSDELIHYIIFFGTHPERRNQGDKAKKITLECLKQYKKKMTKNSYEINSQILLSLSNVLLYDDQMVQELVQQVDQDKETLSIKDMIKFQHCLYKLNIHNEKLSNYVLDQFLKQKEQIDYLEYIHDLHIRSNLLQMGLIDEKIVLTLLQGFQAKLNSTQNSYYTSKSCFQYCQLMYNLYPEIIEKPFFELHPKEDNIFAGLFKDLMQDYVISKQLVDRKKFYQSFEYYINFQNMNVLKAKEDAILRSLTELEQNVQDLLNALNYKNSRAHRVLIYDIDYLVKDNIILTCNDPVHFVEDFDGKILTINPNHIMQSRHLSATNKYKVFDINYHEWIHLNEQQKIDKLKSLID
ncbi:unnamed protein product (macronuclear) [Paramecium tetraurelia]|uniref:RAP domain-containing protein n=1 Tax=Paramecium tetraurelia TaxID=5888 RepID=A0DFH3_PARTE|nr:uncharacterized protein GSPATT00016603001 [Paramecium tetraurelia]CAK81790.1 unnamed protein product [Paramecium tetraurelia]|eukprot:XP_001449187.1 hypothetical protein (macronuclear) [Paramecium tetraurelia strain d4-2]